MPLTRDVANGKAHRTGSFDENDNMYRENRDFFGPRGEPVGSHPLSRAPFGRCRAHLYTSKTSEKMAVFHASSRRNFWHLLTPLHRGTPQVRRFAGQPSAKILGKNEPRDEMRAANLLDRCAAPTGSARKWQIPRGKRASRSAAVGELVRSTPVAQPTTVVEMSKPSGKAGLAIRRGRRTCGAIEQRPKREPVRRRWGLTSFDPSHPRHFVATKISRGAGCSSGARCDQSPYHTACRKPAGSKRRRNSARLNILSTNSSS